MGTTAEKLTYLNTTKSKIRTGLNDLGAGLTDNDTFRSYANALVDIYDELPKVPGSGTDLELTPTKKGKMSIGLKGNSSQDGEPTPDISIPVKVVTGENSLVLQNENLFDDKKRGKYFNNQNQFVNIDNAITTSYIPAREGDKFTIYTKTASIGVVIASFDSEYHCLQREAIGTSSQSLTHTCPANTRYIIGSNYIGVSTDTTLVKGDTPLTTYIVHQSQTYPLSLGNIELNSSPDGTISDEIRGTLDNWFKREYIGKAVFDGNEEWSVGEVGTNPYIIAINGLKSSISSGSNPSYVYCNYFRGISYDDRATGGDNIVYSVAGTPGTPARLYFRNTNFANLTSWQNFLQEKYNNGNPVVAIYVKSSYTDIPITDATLISQLNDIYENAKSYNGTTNITSTYENGNEQMIIDASALKSWNDSNE